MEEKNNKKMVLAIIGVIVLIAGVVGLTIAYFRVKAQSENITVSSKRLSIVFSEGEDSLIRATDIEPISDSDIDTLATKKTFTVAKANDTDKDVYLKFELINLEISDNFKDSDLRWALYKEGEIVTEGSFVNVKDSDTLPLANNIYLDTTTPVEYNLYIWIRENEAEQERLMGGSLSGKIQVTGTEKFTEGIVNEGVLASGMIPVVYDEENDVWVKAGGDAGWYDYDNQQWANTIIVKDSWAECTATGTKGDLNDDGMLDYEDVYSLTQYSANSNNTGGLTSEEFIERGEIDGLTSSINAGDWFDLMQAIQGIDGLDLCTDHTIRNMEEEYLAAEPGTAIEMKHINGFYTWIPRYKYKINNTGTVALPSEIDIIFESGVTATGVSINDTGVAVSEYYTHPSFRDGSTVYKTTAYDQSGWDKELSGYWVSKFETNGATGVADAQADSRPDRLSALSGITTSYTSKYFSNAHIMKNTEWGAIAYLSQSKYGKMGNSNFTGANKEIYINNSYEMYTGRSAGAPSGVLTISDVYAGETSTEKYSSFGFYTYDDYFLNHETTIKNGKVDLKGTGASTTGNITGVYDMSGGIAENVMANYNNLTGTGCTGFDETYFADEANKKYYDSYSDDKTYILGDATYETSGWYNDAVVTFSTSTPYLSRGGGSEEDSASGIFAGTTISACGKGNYVTYRTIILP